MQINKIVLIKDKQSTDTVYLFVDLLPPFPLLYPQSPTALCIQAQAGYGAEWCKKNFNREPDETINR